MSLLAQKVGVSESYISLLESGERQQPSRELVLKLAHALGASSQNQLADDFLVTAGYYPTQKQVYQAHGDTLSHYRDQIALDPQDFVSYSGLIFALIKMGQTEQAQELIQKGFAQFADSLQLQSLLASLELAKQNFQKAIDFQSFAFEQLRQTDVSAEELHRFQLNLGVMHFLKAYHHLEQALHQPTVAGEQKQLAEQHFLTAHTLFSELLQQTPEHIYLLDEYARVCFNLAALGEPETTATQAYWQASIKSLQKVLCAEHKYMLGRTALIEASLFLSHAYSKNGQFEKAELLFNLLEVNLQPAHWMLPYLQACFFSLRAQSEQTDSGLERALAFLQQAQHLNAASVAAHAPVDPDLAWLRQQYAADFERLFA